MHLKRNIIISSILFGLIAVSAVLIFRSTKPQENSGGLASGSASTTDVASQPEVREGQDEATQTDLEIYVHPSGLFSFSYPRGLEVSTADNADGSEVITAEEVGKKNGFQVVISAFDEKETVLSAERLRRDLPDLVVEEPQTALIGEQQFPALIFWSRDVVIGRTREAWFVYEGKLYQISAYEDFDPILARIMKSWEF